MHAVAEYSRRQIALAGDTLRHADEATDDELFEAIVTVDGWRASHALPLGRVNAGLRYYVRKVGVASPEVTQRLKRFATIADKLQRQPRMVLSRMEDIGGVRAILPESKSRLTPWSETFAGSRNGGFDGSVSMWRGAILGPRPTAIVLFTL